MPLIRRTQYEPRTTATHRPHRLVKCRNPPIPENTMLDIMFNIHEHSDIGVCRITEGTVLQGEEPIYEERKASA